MSIRGCPNAAPRYTFAIKTGRVDGTIGMGGVTLADRLRAGLDGFGDRADGLIGMKLLVDPSAFILGEEWLRVAAPDPAGLLIRGIGKLAQSGRHSYRLYPESWAVAPGERFLELALSPQGPVVRWFAAILTEGLSGGAALADWALPPAGKLGGATIATPAGDTYQRVAPPGSGWAMPPTRYERVETGGPGESRRRSGHLFARDTGATAPAPATEFLWAEKVEYRAGAWVVLAAGIGLDPAAVMIS